MAPAPVAVIVGSASLGQATTGHRPIPARASAGTAQRTAGLRLCIHGLERCAPEHVLAPSHRHRDWKRLAAPTGPPGGLGHRPAQAHAGQQTRRTGISADQTSVGAVKKGAIQANASFELWYADATTFDLLPYLARCWMPTGRQPAVKTPGKNKKLAAFGALCYGRGLFLHHTQPRVTAWGMRHLVQRLLQRAKRTGRRIVLVLDQGNPNHAHALHRDLELAEPYIQVLWLPKYCWNLNLIERLWKHIKGSRIANVLFASHRQFVLHVQAALEDFAKHPDLTLSAVNRTLRMNIHRNLVAYT
jgi:hypothetical protein